MEWMRILVSRCTALFRHRALDAELDEELRSHLSHAIEQGARLSARPAISQSRRNHTLLRVLWLIVQRDFALATSDVAIGLAGTAIASRVVSSLLFDISALDALALGSASTFLLLVALAARAIPARRATRIDPIQVLRTE